MQRKPALVVATAVTLACGGGLVAAAAMTGSPMLGFAHRHQSAPAASVAAPIVSHPRVVTRTKNVYDTIVVPTTVAPAPTPTPATNAISVRTVVTSPTAAAPIDAPPTTATPADPTTTTTLPSVTTTTQPRHRGDDGGSDDPPGDD